MPDHTSEGCLRSTEAESLRTSAWLNHVTVTAHEIVTKEAEAWGLKKISKPMVQHGTYSFYFLDSDNNAWEILANPAGGYAWGFERGDQSGRGHVARDFARPESTLARSD
jgi:hypothetical protein